MTSTFNFSIFPAANNFPTLIREWREDATNFLRHDAPKIVLVLVVSYVLIWLVRTLIGKIATLQIGRSSGARVQQVKTLSGVASSVAVSAIVFVGALEVLSLLGLNLGPLLASAGIAGLAIGFGAQALVKDVINGFFILLEDQFNVGDMVRIAGVKGWVEDMSLRRTSLRDDDGAIHIVPNSQITIVSNLTRDWSQFPLRVTVAYSEPSQRIEDLLRQTADDLRHDPAFAQDFVGDIQIPGIDRVGNGETEYLMLIKTRPNKQYGVSRELRRRIKDCFEKNNVKAAAPGRVYVMEQGEPGLAASQPSGIQGL
jgi:small conductance mechanosensitive channel